MWRRQSENWWHRLGMAGAALGGAVLTLLLGIEIGVLGAREERVVPREQGPASSPEPTSLAEDGLGASAQRLATTPEPQRAFRSASLPLLLCVRDATSGARVPNAAVSVEPGTAISDAPGGCWRVPASAGATVHISAIGYFPWQIGYRDLLGLTPDQDGEGRSAYLHRAGSLHVTVIDQGGTPVEGAYVRVECWDEAAARAVLPGPQPWPEFQPPWFYKATASTDWVILAGTDPQGRLTIPILPAGRPLQVTASGACLNASRVVTIDPQALSASLEISTGRAITVTGRVIDHAGRSVPGVMVEIVPEATDIAVRRTNSLGEYRFVGVPPKFHVIRSRVPGAEVHLAPPFKPEMRLPNIVLAELVQVSGQVVLPWGGGDSDCFDLTEFDVCAISASGSVSPVPVGNDGSFALSIEPGPAELSLRHRWNGQRVAAREVEAPMADAILEVGTGCAVRLRLLAAVPPRHASVHLWPQDNPLSDVVTWFHDRGRGIRQQVTLDKDGVATLRGISPGSYCLGVRTPDGGSWLPDVNIPSEPPPEEAHSRLDAAAVTGIVRTPDGKGVGEVRLFIRDWAGGSTFVVSRDNGSFDCSGLLPGPVLIGPELPGMPTKVARGVVLRPGVCEPVEIELPVTGTIAGKVTRSGAPVHGAKISLVAAEDSNSGCDGHATTNSQGEYIIAGVFPGEVRISLVVSNPGGEYLIERGIQVAAGEVEDVSFVLPEELVRCSFREGGRPVGDVDSLVVDRAGQGTGFIQCEVELGIPEDVLEALARPGAVGTVIRRSLTSTMAGVTVPATSFVADFAYDEGGGVVFALHTGTLEVVNVSKKPWIRPPVAQVIAIDREPIEHATYMRPVLAYDGARPDRVVFQGVPRGATVAVTIGETVEHYEFGQGITLSVHWL